VITNSPPSTGVGDGYDIVCTTIAWNISIELKRKGRISSQLHWECNKEKKLAIRIRGVGVLAFCSAIGTNALPELCVEFNISGTRFWSSESQGGQNVKSGTKSLETSKAVHNFSGLGSVVCFQIRLCKMLAKNLVPK